MFVEPKFKKTIGEKIHFSNETIIRGHYEPWMSDKIEFLASYSNKGVLCEKIIVNIGIPKEITSKIKGWKYNPEGFVIELGQETYIYAEKDALHLAFATLIQLCENEEAYEMLLWDYPATQMRGYRIFVPSREEKDAFKNTIDLLEKYRFNYIIMEIGGAMEYKKHPEVNEGWVEYCKEMREYTGKSIEVQYLSYDWCKNAIHADNCSGSYLTQNEVRELIDYCCDHGIEVIPEMPSLSHCDYMLTRHPELAERSEDPYPDTYCPCNEGSYELYFDLLEEVIDVVKPRFVNIGHDELYSISLCEKCKNKNPAELFAKDITRIHDWLYKHNIKTMMWIDKLCEGHESGSEIHITTTKNKVVCVIPEIYPARNLIPKDIILLNWHSNLEDQERILLDMGFPIVYGNFGSFNVNNFRKRIDNGVSGAFFSNWGSLGKVEMQRNGQMTNLFGSAYVLWDNKVTNDDFEQIHLKTLKELHKYCTSNIKNPITITHATPCLMKNYVFYDGIFFVDKMWHMGDYRIDYTDGTLALLPVRYGCEISHNKLWFNGKNPALNNSVGNAIPIKVTSEPHHPIFFNTPFMYNPPKENTDVTVDYDVYYSCVYENPYPEKEIKGVTYVPNPEWDPTRKDDNPLINNDNTVIIKDIIY